MNKPISKGDLVMIARPAPCCGNIDGMGFSGQVVGFVVTQLFVCSKCCTTVPVTAIIDDRNSADIRRLVRIDPNNPFEETLARKELTA